MSIKQLIELESRLFMSEDHHYSDLVAYVIGLRNEVEALEEQIEDIETLEAWEKKNGAASAYYEFFNECFERLPTQYPCPSVTNEYDKSVIFDAIEGEPLKEALYKALPFVEDAEDSQDFKPGAVAKIIKEIKQVLGE